MKAALDAYNAENKAAGATDKVITYSDVMGALMSSVTKIVDIISCCSSPSCRSLSWSPRS